MKFIYPELGIEDNLHENQIKVIVIENSKIFSELVQDIIGQIDLEKGNLILHEDGEVIDFSKSVELIVNPFVLDFNTRKIQVRVMSEIREIINTELLEKTLEMKSNLCLYMEHILDNISYPLIYDTEIDMIGIVKAMEVKMDSSGNSLLENLINYIKVYSVVCGSKVFFCVNIMSFIDKKDLKYLLEEAEYLKIYLILLENKEYQPISNESIIIVDRDACIIYNN